MASRLSRRTFLAGSALSLASPWLFAEERPMPMRELGRTGLKVSLAGLGCFQIGQGWADDKKAAAIVHRAIDLGINYIDTAHSYGRSEERLGKALKGKRDKVILATKTQKRDRKAALKELDESLKRLKTDHVDLWQFHDLASKRESSEILGKDGALAAAREAKKAGKVRFIGITGHEDPHVFVDMMNRQDFDALLIPLNCIDPWHLSFEEHALPVASKKKVGVVAMKVFCSGRLPSKKIVAAEPCLRYTYGLPISTCLVGCRTVEEVELAAHVARNLKAMDKKERDELRAATKKHSPDLEWYKKK